MSFFEAFADGVDAVVSFVWGFGIPTGTGSDIPFVVILLLGAGL
jgi:AGCS family alanine or glycine:cation symporter